MRPTHTHTDTLTATHVWQLNHFLGLAKLIWSSSWQFHIHKYGRQMQMSRLSMKFHSPSLPPSPPSPLLCIVCCRASSFLCLHFVIVSTWQREIIVISTRKSHLAHVTPFLASNCFGFPFFRYIPLLLQPSSCDPCQPVTLAITVSHIPLLRSVATFALAFVVNITHWQNICLN